ncbi:MAG: hypothetical protein IT581_12320 [Verrucomicrobiales bacterium]|nr:hypothetical protein [Verrucomicrobiales bacterium]
MKKTRPSRAASTLLGLAFDADRLEVVLLRRTNGSVEVQKSLAAPLSLEPLSDSPELLGLAIRKVLEEAGIKERRCTVCLPLEWLLTLQVRLPDLPPEDVDSMLQLEAEQGFPFHPETLVVAQSKFRTPAGESYATLAAVPRDHVARLEKALASARLKPISFTPALPALWRAEDAKSGATVALMAGERRVDLMITGASGGLALVRTLDGVYDHEEGARHLDPEQLCRELRVTLGQIPADLRDALRQIMVLGSGEATNELAEALADASASWGLAVQQVRVLASEDFAVKLPKDTPVTRAILPALRSIAGTPATLEFLPPRVSAWAAFAAKYSNRKVAAIGAIAAATALLVGTAFLVQQIRLWHWQSKWNGISKRVTELERIQGNIRRFRAWDDDSYRSLAVLRHLTESFPENGTVSAKSVELRPPATVICTGSALNRDALISTLEKLRSAREVADVKVEQLGGKTPIEFTFNFQWNEGANP